MGVNMRITALLCVVIGGLMLSSGEARAEKAGPFRLLGSAKTGVAGAPTVEVTPVGVGPGWHGWGWYVGNGRPTAPYAGSYNRPYYAPAYPPYVQGYYGGSERGYAPYHRHK